MIRIKNHLKLCLDLYKHWDFYTEGSWGFGCRLKIMMHDMRYLEFYSREQLWNHIQRTKANIKRKHL